MNKYHSHIDKLRDSGLRLTEQRLAICKILFDRKETIHFTVEELKKTIEKNIKSKISLATLYNTVHALQNKGYLKEISFKGNKTFFDTNTNNHHHFYDEERSELMDIEEENISVNNMPKIPKGKKIKGIEITIKLENNNQNQKK